jgi:peroxiredoxin
MPRQNFSKTFRAIDAAVTERGDRLVQLAEAGPILLVFLRHAGCTFCREALSDIARDRASIEQTGTRIVLVHMGDSAAMEEQLEKYGLRSVDRICDPDTALYSAFGLKRGKIRQLFGPKVIWRGFLAGLLNGHGVGRPAADSFQLPGVFVIQNSMIFRCFRHKTVSDRPDYYGLCAERGYITRTS